MTVVDESRASGNTSTASRAPLSAIENRALWRIARRSMRSAMGRTVLVCIMTIIGMLAAFAVTAISVGVRVGEGATNTLVSLLLGLFQSLPLVAVALAPSALITSAAFSVSTKRRMAEYRRLRSIGARDQQILRLVTFEAVVPAVLSGLVVIAVAMGYLLVSGAMDVGPTVAPFYATFVGLATLGVTVAAIALAVRFPAKAILRSSTERTVAVRSAVTTEEAKDEPSVEQRTRPTSSRADRVSASLGVLFGLAGFAALISSAILTNRGEFVFSLPVVGALLVFAGIVFLLGPTIGVIGWLAPRLPQIGRLAVRDLQRNRTRSVALLGAAVGVATLATMGVAGFLSDVGKDGTSMDDRFILAPAWGGQGSLGETVHAAVDVEREAQVNMFYDPVRFAEIEAKHKEMGFGAQVTSVMAGSRIQGEVRYQGYGNVYGLWPVAEYTDELAAALDLSAESRTAAAAGAIVLLRAETEMVVTIAGEPAPFVHEPMGLVGDRERYESALPEVLISADLAADLGLEREVDRDLTLWVASSGVTSEQRSAITGTDLTEHLFVFADSQLSAGAIERIATAVAAAIALGLGLTAAGLAASEAGPEISAMIATGARPSIRRRLLAAQTWIYLTIAGVIGSGLGVLLFYAVTRGDPTVPDPIFPWLTMAVLTFVVPAVAAAVVALGFRSGSPAVSRRAVA